MPGNWRFLQIAGAKLLTTEVTLQAFAAVRPDGRYNFTISNLTLAVLDEPTLNGLGQFKDQLLSETGASPDVFGLLALSAMLNNGQVEYIPYNIQRIFGEQ